MNLIMRAKKIVSQSSDFPVRRTGSYRHKKALVVIPGRIGGRHYAIPRSVRQAVCLSIPV